VLHLLGGSSIQGFIVIVTKMLTASTVYKTNARDLMK